MKKSHHIIRYSLCLLCLHAFIIGTAENEEKEFSTLDFYKTTQFSLSRPNASSFASGEWYNYSDIHIGTNHENGNFHRPQQPKTATNYFFSAEGALKMGDYFLTAGFNFQQTYNKDVKFTSILDPYRGTPYILADSTGGNWQKQSYDMWAKGATPFFYELISFGLDLELAVGRGAKKVDPRPQSNVNRLSAAPSITLKRDKHSIGGYLQYKRFQENTNIILYNTGEPQKMYLLKGMGQYTYDIFSNNERERQYKGDGWGYGFQYGLNSTSAVLNIHGDYNNYTEEAMDIESNKPRKRGRLYETSYKAGVNLNIFGERSTHTISFFYRWRERSGRELIQAFNPSPDVNAWETTSEAPRRSVNLVRNLSGNYTLFLHRKPANSDNRQLHGYTWRLDINALYTDYSDTYKVMKSEIGYKQLQTGVGLLRNFSIGKGHTLQFHMAGEYRVPWNRTFQYTARETEDRTIENDLVYADRDILFKKSYSIEVDALFSYRLKPFGNIYLQIGYTTVQAQDNLSRNGVSARFGYQF